MRRLKNPEIVNNLKMFMELIQYLKAESLLKVRIPIIKIFFSKPVQDQFFSDLNFVNIILYLIWYWHIIILCLKVSIPFLIISRTYLLLHRGWCKEHWLMIIKNSLTPCLCVSILFVFFSRLHLNVTSILCNTLR